jgi:serine/threonine-protein kinase
MSTPMTEAKVLPDRIGRYRIVRPLSKGGMALVYEGRKESLGGVAPRVAVKVILPDYATSSTFRELFINEARLGAAMQHQNLVQILDFDSDGDRYFIVMEYVDGYTLSKMIGLAARHDVKIPLQVICEVGRQACEGLHYAHQAVDNKGRALNMIHRDIKPSNLIVNSEGGVKILDFGISKGRLRHERSGSVKGTWGYMAPEQAAGERIGPNADVFGLGIVLYEMASRRSMFKGRKEDEIRQMLMADHAARVAATLDPSFAPLAKVLARALHRDPKQRFATAADFGRSLSELLPDPLAVREEMVRFHRTIRDLAEREGTKSRADDTEAPYEQSVRMGGGRFTLDASREDQGRFFVVSALAGMVAVVAAFLFGYALYRAVVPDPGPPLPPLPSLRSVDPEQVTDARPVPVPEAPLQKPPVTPPAAAPTPATIAPPIPTGADPCRGDTPPVLPLAASQGGLVLCSAQPAEIYLDGKLVQKPALAVAAGKHVIAFVSTEGRGQVSQQVEVVEARVDVKKWNFDKWDWDPK